MPVDILNRLEGVYEGIYYEELPVGAIAVPLTEAYYKPPGEPRANRVVLSPKDGAITIRWDNDAVSGGGHFVPQGAFVEICGWHTIRKFHITSAGATAVCVTYER